MLQLIYFIGEQQQGGTESYLSHHPPRERADLLMSAFVLRSDLLLSVFSELWRVAALWDVPLLSDQLFD
ncbi:MAG: hypothetical protein AAGL69_17840, partial [Pseudomonadota bacterium]